MTEEKDRLTEEILLVFEEIIPRLSENGKARLLGMGEGMKAKLDTKEMEVAENTKKGA